MPFPFDLKPVNYGAVVRRLSDASYQAVGDLTVDAWITDEPVPFDKKETGLHTRLSLKQPWGKKLFDCAWMRFTGVVPDKADGLPVALLIDFNGEGLVVDSAGEPLQGLTTVASEFDTRHGFPGKKVVRLTQSTKAGDRIEIWVDAANNDLFGKVQNSGALQRLNPAYDSRRLVVWECSSAGSANLGRHVFECGLRRYEPTKKVESHVTLARLLRL